MRNKSLTVIHKFIAIFLALNFLNNCVDSVDPITHRMVEDLSYNDIESVTELIAEVIFSFDNACIELEDNDSEDNGMKEKIEYAKFKNDNPKYLFVPNIVIYIETCFDEYSHQYHPEVTPPPPKV